MTQRVCRLRTRRPGKSLRGTSRDAARLAQSLAEHRAILASVLDPVVTIDSRGIIQSVSDSVSRVFGYSADELLGKSIAILMPEPHRSAHVRYLRNYRRSKRTKVLGRTNEIEAVRKDGTRVAIELSVSRADVPGRRSPLFTGVIRDITERRRAEQRMNLLQTLMVAVSQAGDLKTAMSETLRRICGITGWDYGEAWVPDETGTRLVERPTLHTGPERLRRFHDASRHMSFSKGEGLPGRAWESRRPEWIDNLSNDPGFGRAEAASRTGLTAGVGVPIIAGNEVVAVISFFMARATDEDKRLLDLVQAAVALLGPVIERKRVEDELARHHHHLEELVRERTTELEQSHEQLRTADRLVAIGTLAAGLGHDMNNVLLPIRCRLDALDVAQVPAGLREQFQSVRRSLAYLQQLSDGLRLLSLNPDDPGASGDCTDLHEWWDQTGSLLRKAAPKGALFDASVPATLPRVAVPPHRLTQAVLNLVVNAGEAIAPGGRIRVWAEASPDRGQVRLGVTDDGCGMTDDVKRRALDPFFTTKRRGLGTGLGLPLVHGVARAAGGTMTIRSAPGEGTTVELGLPASRDQGERAGGRSRGPCRTAVVSIREQRSASFVAAFLRSAGFRVRLRPGATPGTASLWVTEPSAAMLRGAERFCKGGPIRQVVLFGEPTAGWRELGAITVRDTENFEAIRGAIGEAVSAVRGGSEP